MPYRMLARTMRNLCLWRLVLLTVAVYVVIRLSIPWLVNVGVPFWVRAIPLALLPAGGVMAGSWLFPRKP